MPYQQGNRLPGERASRLGHLDVLKSELVNKFVKGFEDRVVEEKTSTLPWSAIPSDGKILPIVFGVDGSVQTVVSETPPYKALAFVKTALLRLDQNALASVDRETPHPLVLRDILEGSALYHATVFPLRNVSVSGMSLYDAIRKSIFESVKDASLNGELFETLKWIVYKKWNESVKEGLPRFGCPHCEQEVATLPYDGETGNCPSCKGELFLTDMLGFHQEMAPDDASDSLGTSYMSINETLLLFTGIRYFWQTNKGTLSKCLFVKDGPLSIRAQYSKLVEPIRNFLEFAKKEGVNVHILGQEKSGRFYEHLQLIGANAPEGTFFLPGNRYIKEKIQNRPDQGAPYGKDTNYGAKLFVKLSSYHQMVLNVPTGQFNADPAIDDLIGIKDIFASLPSILGNRHEGSLLPVELAHGVASLSTYPSAHILKIFADTNGNHK